MAFAFVKCRLSWYGLELSRILYQITLAIIKVSWEYIGVKYYKVYCTRIK